MDELEELEQGLIIDRNGLDDALLQQPEYFYRIAQRLTYAKSRRDEAKKVLEETEARVDFRIRRDIAQAGEKVTEKQVESYKVTNTEVKEARMTLLSLNKEVGLLDALKEAYVQRAKTLSDLSSLYVAGYFGGEVRSAQAGRIRADRIKEEINKEREAIEHMRDRMRQERPR